MAASAATDSRRHPKSDRIAPRPPCNFTLLTLRQRITRERRASAFPFPTRAAPRVPARGMNERKRLPARRQVADDRAMTAAPRKLVALILSGIFPGLGQIYNRQPIKGAAFLAV